MQPLQGFGHGYALYWAYAIEMRAVTLRNHKSAHNGENTLPLTESKDPSIGS